MQIAVFIRNLMFGEKLLSAAKDHEVWAIQPDNLADLASRRPDLVVVDLTEPGWQDIVRAAEALGPEAPRVLGFGPHVRADLFAEAREMGVDRAVANSKFAENPAGLLAEMLVGVRDPGVGESTPENI